MSKDMTEDREIIQFIGDQENTEIATLENALNDLEVDENLDNIREAIFTDDLAAPATDILGIIYAAYAKCDEFPNADQDMINDIKTRTFTICRETIQMISNRFELGIDMETLKYTDIELIALAKALYKFFVMHLVDSIKNPLINYISSHIEDLGNNFRELTKKTDIVTTYSKGKVNENTAIIVSNIYDIADYILSIMDANLFVDHLSVDEGNPLNGIIFNLVKTEVITGEFVVKLADLYKSNLGIRAQVSMDIYLHFIEDATKS